MYGGSNLFIGDGEALNGDISLNVSIAGTIQITTDVLLKSRTLM